MTFPQQCHRQNCNNRAVTRVAVERKTRFFFFGKAEPEQPKLILLEVFIPMKQVIARRFRNIDTQKRQPCPPHLHSSAGSSSSTPTSSLDFEWFSKDTTRAPHFAKGSALGNGRRGLVAPEDDGTKLALDQPGFGSYVLSKTASKDSWYFASNHQYDPMPRGQNRLFLHLFEIRYSTASPNTSHRYGFL
jgi:hypothetical protein